VENENPYYDVRDREFGRQNGDFEEQRRFEHVRYGACPKMTEEPYSGKYEIPTSNQHLYSIRRPNSLPPSSFAIIQGEIKAEVEARRPLHLGMNGKPTRKMESHFKGDIISFIKDMDPTQGWEGQTKDDKERLLSCLMSNYEMYGDSRKLSKKYLRK